MRTRFGKVVAGILIAASVFLFLNWGIKFNRESKKVLFEENPNEQFIERQFIEERINFLNNVIMNNENYIAFDYMKMQGISKSLAEKELRFWEEQLKINNNK